VRALVLCSSTGTRLLYLTPSAGTDRQTLRQRAMTTSRILRSSKWRRAAAVTVVQRMTGVIIKERRVAAKNGPGG